MYHVIARLNNEKTVCNKNLTKNVYSWEDYVMYGFKQYMGGHELCEGCRKVSQYELRNHHYQQHHVDKSIEGIGKDGTIHLIWQFGDPLTHCGRSTNGSSLVRAIFSHLSGYQPIDTLVAEVTCIECIEYFKANDTGLVPRHYWKHYSAYPVVGFIVKADGKAIANSSNNSMMWCFEDIVDMRLYYKQWLSGQGDSTIVMKALPK